MKKEELIGKEVTGFKFLEGTSGLSYITKYMDAFIGVRGKIVRVDKSNGMTGAQAQVMFPLTGGHRSDWWYPVSMIKNYLIENSENSNSPEIFQIL